MLAKLCGSLGDLTSSLAGRRFQADYKYDGQRAQLHLLADGTARVFSRHLEDMTSRYPDAVRALQDAVRLDPESQRRAVKSCIVDAEIVAVDSKTGGILSFQTLQSRPRKDVKEADITTSVQVMLFDIMQLNGTSLLEQDLEVRYAALRSCFQVLRPRVGFVERRAFEPEQAGGAHDVNELTEFLHGSLRNHCEGVMVKELGPTLSAASAEFLVAAGVPRGLLPALPDRREEAGTGGATAACAHAQGKTPPPHPEQGKKSTTYVPSRRCANWVKVKKDYLAGLADTIDVVPIGAWWGSGRKAGCEALLCSQARRARARVCVCPCE